MSIEVRVPTLPESVADATVVGWHKKPGEFVKEGENLVDLETDKVVLEVPAPTDGTLGPYQAEVGDVVSADDVLAAIEPGAAPTSASANSEPATKAKPARVDEADSGDAVLTPSVRRMIKELDLDPTKIEGSGKGGRILRADVIRYMDAQESNAPEVDPEAGSLGTDTHLQPIAGLSSDTDRPEQRVAMTRLRARVAERLVQAQRTAAILTTFNEVNLQAVTDLRNRHKDSFEKHHEVRLGFMSFFVKAAVEALKRYPVVNASVDGEDIIYHGYYDIGIAVGSPRGLVVPILRNCDQLSFAEIEKRVREFGKKAQNASLSYEDLTGGTFTISNGGVYGSMLSTPILNPPQSAILGMHSIQQRPVVENGEIIVRPMMYLALSYDHRIIDGREAVQFLVAIKEMLEDPARLLLEI